MIPIFKDIPITPEVLTLLTTKTSIDPSLLVKAKSIPAALLIDDVGLQGKTIGTASLSDTDSNILLEGEPYSAEDRAMLISYIKQQVRDAYGIQLEEETKGVD
jgi:UDP-N-acetylenolpyruvoylglucosamine reductase